MRALRPFVFRTACFVPILASVCLGLIGVTSALGQDLPQEPIVCEYPRLADRPPFASLNPTRLISAAEVEPNNSATQATPVSLGFGMGQQPDVDVTGRIDRFDKDWLRFEAKRGETLGVAVLAIDAGILDSIVSVRSSAGAILLQNDQHGGLASFYPPESPFPAGGTSGDAALTFAIPADGTYYVVVEGRGASSGGYLAQLRLREPPLRNTAVGTHQILFLDFNGATGIHADDLFGAGGIHNASLSKLDDFLPGWGIAANRRDALIDKIVANVRGHFDSLLIGTSSRIEIRNSKDHPDPFGQPHVSRVIAGGKISELGISTIGIAEHIDPANFSTDDTAVVLLDLLSAPASNPNAVLSLPRAPGLSVEDAVARVVANVITHEACHFLGCWHTENSNATFTLIDRGGNLPNLAGVGPDGILGTGDDRPSVIVDDNYAFEGIGRSQDVQNVRAQVIASLSVGTVAPVVEINEVRAMIAGLEAARKSPLAAELPPAFSPNDTRKALGLTPQSPDSFAPRWEPTQGRFDNVLKKWNGRLEALEKK